MVIKNKPEDLLNYLEDTSNLKGKAQQLYLPQTVSEVSQAIEECYRRKTPFTVSGGRTGTTGGCVPEEGAVISLEKLNKIIDIDPQKQIACLEAGVSLEELEKEANEFGLTLRASPTESLAFSGGAVSTAASGVRGFGYGGIRNYVSGMEIVLPTGEWLDIGRGEILARGRNFDFVYSGRQFQFKIPSYNLPAVKSQAGYYVRDNMDLIDLFIGSEGTLGVITSCRLKLQKIPLNIFDGLVFFPSEERAFWLVEAVRKMKAEKVPGLAALEFFDSNSLRMLKQAHTFVPEAEAAVYFEQEAESDKEYDACLERWQSLIEASGASLDQCILADTPSEREKVFEFRHKLPQEINELLRQTGQVKAASDIAVPWPNFRELYAFYRRTAEASGLNYVNFGHIGESHLHFNFLPRTVQESVQARKCLEEFCRQAVALGGSVSAEHGIGKIKKPYLKIMYSEESILEMAALKKYFDPDCLLGLDNIFEKELLRDL